MKNRVITLQQEIDRIIQACEVCHISMIASNGKPYGIPMNFGYSDGVIHLHSSYSGEKIDALRQNPSVCIAFSTDHDLRWQSEKVACSYSMRYKSVLAFGEVKFVEDMDEKVEALNSIMKNYTTKEFTYSDPALKEVCVFKVVVSKFDGRAYGY